MNTPFDAGHLIDAVRTGALPPCTISLSHDDFVALIVGGIRGSGCDDVTFESLEQDEESLSDEDIESLDSLGADFGLKVALHGPNGPVIVKTEPLVELKGHKFWSKAQEEEVNPTPVAADDIPCERIEYPCEFVGEKPSASITKRKLDERPIEPSCTCGGRACGTTCATWCDTQRRK